MLMHINRNCKIKDCARFSRFSTSSSVTFTKQITRISHIGYVNLIVSFLNATKSTRHSCPIRLSLKKNIDLDKANLHLSYEFRCHMIVSSVSWQSHTRHEFWCPYLPTHTWTLRNLWRSFKAWLGVRKHYATTSSPYQTWQQQDAMAPSTW